MSTPIVKEVVTVLDHIGHLLALGFKDGVKIAQEVQPEVDLALPGIATAFNMIVASCAQAEALGTVAGLGPGTGPQKSASVVAVLTSFLQQQLAQAGIANVTEENVAMAVNAVVLFMKAWPAPVGSPARLVAATPAAA